MSFSRVVYRILFPRAQSIYMNLGCIVRNQNAAIGLLRFFSVRRSDVSAKQRHAIIRRLQSHPHGQTGALFAMANPCDHRKSYKDVVMLDAADRNSHPMTISDGKLAYHFALGGSRGQDKALQGILQLMSCPPPARYQVPLCCPVCKAGLGSYIYSSSGIQALSENQQRKNRNTMLFGKSHCKRTHALLTLQVKSCNSISETTSTPAEQTVAKRFRAGPSTIASSKTHRPSEPTAYISSKRKHDSDDSTPGPADRSVKQRVKAPAQPFSSALKFQARTTMAADEVPARVAMVHGALTRVSPSHRHTSEGYCIDANGEMRFDKAVGWCSLIDDDSSCSSSTEST